MSPMLDGVYVATCDPEIADYIRAIGGRVVMTKDTHERATDRTCEAMLKIEEERGERADIVVMVQGDEPMVVPEMIEQAVSPMLADPKIEVVNLMGVIADRTDHEDANEVKVVVDQKGYALYFSREPIPTWRKGARSVPMLKQVCIMPFRRDFLLRFTTLPQTPLEVVESIDMLRCLEHGHRVRMVPSPVETYSVDNMEDLAEVEKAMEKDPLLGRYGIARR
jgi:3-deoxy-manno-octulosonate cytidylyltransferase (CMP-KDO synthetase)